MKLIVEIKDSEIDDMIAVGANDLKNHFLPKIGINATSVTIRHIDAENMKLRKALKGYKLYEDIA